MNAAEYIRIFELNPSDDFVTKREAAIRDISGQYIKVKDLNAISKLAESIVAVFTDGSVSDTDESDRIAAAIKKQSSSFVAAGRDLEIGVCGLLALAAVVEGPGKATERLSIADAYAVSLWSALSFMATSDAAKLDDLRLALIAAARRRISLSGLDIRERRAVPVFKQLGEPPIDNAKFSAATQTTIDALRFNAALDREELDILWWALGEASALLEKPLSSLSPQARAITSAYEVGRLMRTLPTQGHRNLVLKHIGDSEPLSLAELLQAIQPERDAFAKAIGKDSLLTAAPLSYPVLNALVAGAATENASNATKRTLREWAERTLLESAITKIQYDKSAQL